VQTSAFNGGTLQETEITVALPQILDAAFSNHYAIAAWQDMGNHKINVIIDLSDHYKTPVIPELESLDAGFLISPFLNESNHLCYLIKADIHFEGENANNLTPKFFAANVQNGDNRDFILLFEGKNNTESKRYFLNDSLIQYQNEGTGFKKIVRQAIEEIRNGGFQKVVPSRKEVIVLPDDFSLAKTFIRLTHHYPEAFVSFFSVPGKGTWVGASPEILISIDEEGNFRTSAVAGTQRWNPDVGLSSVAWTQKEIEEQAYVSRYIINSFKKIRLREFDEYGPKTIRAGNLVHLRTDFTVNIHDVNFPQLGTVMLKLLHPTSAVCGMPKEKAWEFLRDHENYDREFYSGYLGPVNMENRTSLFVNLRCAQLMDHQAFLYAGAGVTLDSNPEKEWEETLIKNQTMHAMLTGNGSN